MNFQLKNIKYASFASQETACYSATLYIDNKRCYQVGNDGHGGCDRIHKIKGVNPAVSIDEITAYFKSLPKVELELSNTSTEMVEQTLESHCAELLFDWLSSKELKGKLKSKVLGLIDNKIFGWPKKGRSERGLILAIKNKYKDAVFLNEVEFNEALSLYKTHAQ